MTRYFKNMSGFTMIELILVMTIMGILGAMIVIRFPASQQRARDTQRRNDLKQYQTALETYANANNGLYPVINPTEAKPSSLCGSGKPLALLTNCPDDPKDGVTTCFGATCVYNYVTNASGATQYALWFTYERPTDSTKPYFVICSTGVTYDSATAPTSASLCP